MIFLSKKNILTIIIFNLIFSNYNEDLNESVEYIIDGNYIYKNKYISNDNNESYYYKKINTIINKNDSKNNFLKGLIEIDGEISKDYFKKFYDENPKNIYADLSVVKVADYYYSRGIYMQASNWYKKIPEEYPDSKYIEKSISYYLNSLLVSGHKDTADFYINKFKKEFPKLRFSNDYVSEYVIKKNNNKKPSTISHKRYSVQIGSFKNYDLAKSKKNVLINEGFLCRIDQMIVSGQTFYAVRTGTFKSEKLAKKEQIRLISRLGIYDSIVVETN